MIKTKFTRFNQLFPSFSQMDETFDEFDRIFDDASRILDGPRWQEVKYAFTKPVVDYHIKSEGGIHTLEVAVPGVIKEQVSVTVTDGKLQVKVDADGHLWTKATNRTFTLPEDADVAGISADVKDGLLKVTIPTLATAVPKEVKIL
jgi:HSP20 family protein